MSAKKEETRARRLATLIDCSARGRKIPPVEALSAGTSRRGRRRA
jgi:hypothetical protein